MAEELNENTEKTNKTVQFTARIKEDDKNYIETFLSQYKVKHEGFSEFVKRVQNNTNTVDTFPYQLELEELKKQLENIQTENQTLRQNQAQTSNAYLLTLPPDTEKKLNVLRRYLKEKNQIPKEDTPIEFVNQLVNHALNYYINNKHDYLNR